MLKVFEGPSHVAEPLMKWGVTVIIAITGVEVVLEAVNDGTLTVPVAASPMAGVSFDQE